MNVADSPTLLSHPRVPGLGQRVADRYQLETVLGQSPYGIAFAAADQRAGGRVVLKVLGPEQSEWPGFAERVLKRLRSIRQLHHPNTATVLDLGETDRGCPFLVVELVDGEPLDGLLAREGGLACGRAEHILRQLLASLAEAHEQGLSHFDLGPRNIMVRQRRGQTDFVSVLDYGVAAAFEEAMHSRVAGGLGGPLCPAAYAAPERLRGLPAGPPADVYAAGLLALEMLTGAPIVRETSDADVVARQLSPDPIPIPDLARRLPLGSWAARAVSKSAEARYPDAGAALDALDQLSQITQDAGGPPAEMVATRESPDLGAFEASTPEAIAAAPAIPPAIPPATAAGRRPPSPPGRSALGSGRAKPSGTEASGAKPEPERDHRGGRVWLVAAVLLLGLGAGVVWWLLEGHQRDDEAERSERAVAIADAERHVMRHLVDEAGSDDLPELELATRTIAGLPDLFLVDVVVELDEFGERLHMPCVVAGGSPQRVGCAYDHGLPGDSDFLAWMADLLDLGDAPGLSDEGWVELVGFSLNVQPDDVYHPRRRAEWMDRAGGWSPELERLELRPPDVTTRANGVEIGLDAHQRDPTGRWEEVARLAVRIDRENHVELEREALLTARAQDIRVGEPVARVLEASTWRESAPHRYRLRLPGPQRLAVEVMAEAFEPALRVLDANRDELPREQIWRDQNGVHFSLAEVVDMPAGEVLVEVSGSDGVYQLQVMPPCQAATRSLGRCLEAGCSRSSTDPPSCQVAVRRLWSERGGAWLCREHEAEVMGALAQSCEAIGQNPDPLVGWLASLEAPIIGAGRIPADDTPVQVPPELMAALTQTPPDIEDTDETEPGGVGYGRAGGRLGGSDPEAPSDGGEAEAHDEGGGEEPDRGRASVDLGRPSVSGFLSSSDVGRVVRRSRGQLRHCYQQGLRDDPDLTGELTVQWTIDLEGDVERVSVRESSLHSRDVEGCVTRVIQRWRFPAPEEGIAVVSFPFTFELSGD